MLRASLTHCFFFFNDTATTEIYTLSLHDALPICVDALGRELRADLRPQLLARGERHAQPERAQLGALGPARAQPHLDPLRSEEHTSELQSRQYLVCRLLLEKKKNKTNA